MTKKDYELIAKTIKEIGESHQLELNKSQTELIARRFAVALLNTNPLNFKGEMFLRACGVSRMEACGVESNKSKVINCNVCNNSIDETCIFCEKREHHEC